MQPETYRTVKNAMNSYTSKGKKSAFKKKQMKRLIFMLDCIMTKNGDPRIEAIGKRQIIQHWKTIEHESDKTRREKYLILFKFFSVFNQKVTVPEPRRIVS